MTSGIEVSAKTVDAAVEKGLQELGIKKNNANIQILAEPGNGWLGLWGAKDARVIVSVKNDPPAYLDKLINELIGIINPEGRVDVEVLENEDIQVTVTGPRMGVLIGRRGQTLNSFHYLVNVIMHRQFDNFKGRVFIDVENYRRRREETIAQLAVNMADKAIRTGKGVFLEPMAPNERRIIHLTLKDNPGVRTHSIGQEPYRKVVISPV